MSSIENPGLHFATLAKVAYLTQAESKPTVHTLGYTKSVLVDHKGAECLIVENKLLSNADNHWSPEKPLGPQ